MSKRTSIRRFNPAFDHLCSRITPSTTSTLDPTIVGWDPGTTTTVTTTTPPSTLTPTIVGWNPTTVTP